MRSRLLPALALAALLATGCTAGGDDPAPAPTTATTSSAPEPSPTATPDPQAEADAAHEALQAALSANLGATSTLLEERQACPPPGEDLACMVEVTHRIAVQAGTDIPQLEAAIAGGGAPCLQEVARLQVEIMKLFVEQDRLFSSAAPGSYPLDAISAANHGVKPLQDQQGAALQTC